MNQILVKSNAEYAVLEYGALIAVAAVSKFGMVPELPTVRPVLCGSQ